MPSAGTATLDIEPKLGASFAAKLEAEAATAGRAAGTKLEQGIASGAGASGATITKLRTALEGISAAKIPLVSSAIDTLTSRTSSAAGVMSKLGIEGDKAGSLLGTGLAAGATAGVIALAGLAAKGVGEFSKLTSEIRSYQRVTGESAEASSRMVGALNALGIPVEGVDKAMFKLARTVADTPEKFSALGVAIAHTKSGSTDLNGTLLNIADAFQKTHDPAQRASLVFAAFGRQGQQLIPILQRGREGLKQLFAETEKHGLIFSQEELNRGKEFGLSMRNLGEAAKGLEISLGQRIIPLLIQGARVGADFVDSLNPRSASADEPFLEKTARGLFHFDQTFARLLPKVEAGQGVIGVLGEKLGLLHKHADGAGEASNRLAVAIANSTKNVTGLDPVLGALGGSAKVSADQVQHLADSLGIDLNGATTEQKQKLLEARDALSFATVGERDLDEATKILSSDISTAGDRAKAFAEGIDALSGQLIKGHDAGLEFNEQILQMGDKLKQNGADLSDNTEKGIANQRMLEGLVVAAEKDAQSTFELTGSRESANAVLAQHTAAIEANAAKLGLDRDQVHALLDVLGLFAAHDWIAKVDADTSGAEAKIDKLAAKLRALEIASAGPPPAGQAPGTTHLERSAQLASGGIIGAASGIERGFITNGPQILVGEGDRRYHEFVIPTDPAFHDNALRLLGAAARDIGGLPAGGDGAIMPAGWSHQGWTAAPEVPARATFDYDRLADAVARKFAGMHVELNGRHLGTVVSQMAESHRKRRQ